MGFILLILGLASLLYVLADFICLYQQKRSIWPFIKAYLYKAADAFLAIF